MKTIVAVNAIPRTGRNTGTLIREAAEGAGSEGAEIKVFDPKAKKEHHNRVFPEER